MEQVGPNSDALQKGAGTHIYDALFWNPSLWKVGHRPRYTLGLVVRKMMLRCVVAVLLCTPTRSKPAAAQLQRENLTAPFSSSKPSPTPSSAANHQAPQPRAEPFSSSEPSRNAAAWAPQLRETLTRVAAGRTAEPFSVAAATGGPPPKLTLLSVLEAFAGKLVPPFMKLTRGAGGEPSSPEDMPADVHEAVEMMTRPRDPWSMVLRLENLASHSMPAFFRELLEPMLPLSGGANSSRSTAHVYVSGHGASALPNHTDVTKIVVLQLLGRKEWLYCREKPRAPGFAATLFPLEAAKLVKCETYDDAEMNSGALDCERVVTAPGDILFLPRRTVHSARAVDGNYSVHLTIGIKSPRRERRRSSEDCDSVNRRLQTAMDDCTLSCDSTCTAQCDDMGCGSFLCFYFLGSFT